MIGTVPGCPGAGAGAGPFCPAAGMVFLSRSGVALPPRVAMIESVSDVSMNSDRRDRGRLGKHRRRSARPENRLRSHAAERSRQVGRLAALQQHHDHQEQAHNYMNNSDKNDHTATPQRTQKCFHHAYHAPYL